MLAVSLASLEAKFNSLTSDSILILNRASMGRSNDEIAKWGTSWGYTLLKIHESFVEIFRVLEFEEDMTTEHARAEAVALFQKCKKAGFPHIPKQSSASEPRIRIKTEPLAKKCAEVAMTVESKHFEALSQQEKNFLSALAKHQNDTDVMRTQKLTPDEFEVLLKDIADFLKLDVKLTPPQRRGELVSMHQRHHVKQGGNGDASVVPKAVETPTPQTVVVRPQIKPTPVIVTDVGNKPKPEEEAMAKTVHLRANQALFKNIQVLAKAKGMSLKKVSESGNVNKSLLNNLRTRSSPPADGFVDAVAKALAVSKETLAGSSGQVQALVSSSPKALTAPKKTVSNGVKKSPTRRKSSRSSDAEPEPSVPSRALTVVDQHMPRLLGDPDLAACVARLSKLLSQVPEHLRAELVKEMTPLMK